MAEVIDGIRIRLRHQIAVAKSQMEKAEAALDALEGFEEPVGTGEVRFATKAIPATVTRMAPHPVDEPMRRLPLGGMKGVPQGTRRRGPTRSTSGKTMTDAVRAALATMRKATTGQIMMWITESTIFTQTPSSAVVSATLCNGKKTGIFRRLERGVWAWNGGIKNARSTG